MAEIQSKCKKERWRLNLVKNYKLFFKFVLTELYLQNLDAITILLHAESSVNYVIIDVKIVGIFLLWRNC